MKREEAKANLVALGVAEPTEEQVTNYLNQLEGETNGLKTRLSNADKNAKIVDDLKKQLEDLQNSKLTDEERAAKEQQEREQRIADLEAKLKATELKSQFANQGITGEDADKLINSLNSGSFDVELLGQIISNRETEAAKKKEQEIAKHTTNPNGGSAGGAGSDEDKGYNEEVVNTVVNSLKCGSEKDASDIVGNYL